jgi:signal transduction histidine kinase
VDITLYSSDPELEKLCRDVLHLSPGSRYVTRNDFRQPPESPGDLCIYDTAAGGLKDLPENSGLRTSILVAGQSEIPTILEKALHLESIILLKPVTRARFEIAIEQGSHEAGNSIPQELMRLNRDNLMEYLLQANLKLQEYDHNRSHFLARAIHELRAPLTSLNGYCGLLLQQRLGPLSDEQLHALVRMRKSVERLTHIVTTMFDLSVGRSAGYKPDYRLGTPLCSVEQALHEILPTIQDRRIDLTTDLLPPAGPLLFDVSQMEEVFLNLLENSCKFTPRGGSICVKGYPYFWERRTRNAFCSVNRRIRSQTGQPNAYRIDIIDNGPGIPPNELQNIFTEYAVYRGGTDRSGSGLGLAICMMIIREHSGKLWADSNGVQGTTFSIALPMVGELPG